MTWRNVTRTFLHAMRASAVVDIYIYIYIYIQELRNSATGPILVKGISKQHHFLMLFFDFVCKPPSQLSFILGRVWEPSWDQVSANSTFFFMIFLDLVCKTNQKIYQKSIKNLSKNQPKRVKNLSKSVPEVFLEPSWPQDDTESQQDRQKSVRGPPWDPQVGGQNLSKIEKKALQNVINFLIGFGIGFESNLVPTWPQLAPQIRSKIDEKSNQEQSKIHSEFYLVSNTFLNRFLIDFGSNLDPPKAPKSLKNLRFFNDFSIFAGRCFHRSWKPTWHHFGTVLGAKLGPNWHEIAQKIDPRGDQKNDQNLGCFWMALGRILGGFWVPSWSQVGTKIEEKWRLTSKAQFFKKHIFPKEKQGFLKN